MECWMPWADPLEKEPWARMFRASELDNETEKCLEFYDIWDKYADLINKKGTYRDFFYYLLEINELRTEDLYLANAERDEENRQRADEEMKAWHEEHRNFDVGKDGFTHG